MELVSMAHLRWKRRVAQALVPYGTNPKQMFVLRKLKEKGPLAPSEIAVLLHADRPTVTSLLKTLERNGWVSRTRDPMNRRRVQVVLTDQGETFLCSVPEKLWRTGKTTLDPEGCFSIAELAEFIQLLKKLNAWLENEDA